MFISFLYMFRVTMYKSSGETTVLMRHLVLVILYGWLVCRVEFIPSCVPSWWWAHSRPKHVEKRINLLRKIVHQVGFIYKTMLCMFAGSIE